MITALHVLALSLSSAPQELPSLRPRQHFPTPNAAVMALEEHEGTLYAGGEFDRVGTFTGPLAVLDKSGALTSRHFPTIQGEVHAIVPDGSGGWFVGGGLDQVGSQVGNEDREGVVHILASGELSSWDPDVSGEVRALLLDQGTLYLAGNLDVADGARRNLAAVDAVSGVPLPWDPAASATGPYSFGARDRVRELAKLGDAIFIGGDFTDVRLGGQVRSHLAVVDAVSGNALRFDARPDGEVLDFLPVGASIVVAGSFKSFAGEPHPGLAWVHANGAVGKLPAVSGSVAALARSGKVLFLGGGFSGVGGVSRDRLAAIDLQTKAVFPWAPVLSGSDGAGTLVYDLAIFGSNVVVSGAFGFVDGEPRQSLAVLDTVSGSPLAWDARVAGHPDSTRVRALAVQNDVLAVGGNLAIANSVVRHGAAAYRVTTGELLSWAPDASSVTAIAFDGERVFLGGTFTTVNGTLRPRVAAVDATTGALDLDFDGGLCSDAGVPWTLASNGPYLFVGGGCLTACGEDCRDLRAHDALTGATIGGWDTRTSGGVNDLELSEDGLTLFVGGAFDEIGSPADGFEQRGSLAAVDAITGAVMDWSPEVSGAVTVLHRDGSRFLIGGSFGAVGGLVRRNAADVDLESGSPGAWDPQVLGFGLTDVLALATDGHDVFLGGGFESMGGVHRPGLGAVDPLLGTPLDWAPNAWGEVRGLLLVDGMLVVSGGRLFDGGVLGELCVFDFPSAFERRSVSASGPSR